MIATAKCIVKGNTVMIENDDLAQYDGKEVVVNVVESSSVGKGYSEDFWKLFGADTDTGFEVPNEIDFSYDSPREKLEIQDWTA